MPKAEEAILGLFTAAEAEVDCPNVYFRHCRLVKDFGGFVEGTTFSAISLYFAEQEIAFENCNEELNDDETTELARFRLTVRIEDERILSM